MTEWQWQRNKLDNLTMTTWVLTEDDPVFVTERPVASDWNSIDFDLRVGADRLDFHLTAIQSDDCVLLLNAGVEWEKGWVKS